MAKRKQKKDTSAQSANALRQNGWQAFSKGDYASAINSWERSYEQQVNPQTAVLLAEALFRRAVNRKTLQELSSNEVVALLQRAHFLRPEDSGYAYHLALAFHRQGQLAAAITLYREIWSRENAFRQRAAYPLALAVLQQGHDPTTAPSWRALSDAEQRMLRYGTAVKGLAALPGDGDDLWQGIIALRNGRYPAAQPLLEQAFAAADNAIQQALAAYGLGLIAARQEDWAAARRHWQTAAANGLKSPHLHANLAELYHRMAEERLQTNDAAGALAAAQEAARLYGERPSSLNELEAQAWQRQGYQAAQASDWPQALSAWLQARARDGGNFRLAYNLALTLEKMEQHEDAADAWREVLRRRPRRADHPDALTDEQVARLWRRAAEAYQKEGAFDEAVQVYRNAVKSDENNLSLRQALAETLLNNGQLRAAENELERILQRDPNSIPALLLMGEALSAEEHWYRNLGAVHYWQKVLRLDPNNAQARHLLADHYVNRAEVAFSWDEITEAIKYYQEALRYQPDDAAILAALGSCYLFVKDRTNADAYIAQAIDRAPDDLRVYDSVIRAWLQLGVVVEAEQVVGQAETAVPHIPFQFYINIALNCLMNEWSVPVKFWLDRAVAAGKPEDGVLYGIGEILTLSGQQLDLAVEYLEAAIAANQLPARAYLMLGIVAIRQNDEDLALKHWRVAEKMARRDKDEKLVDHIRDTRETFTSPMGRLIRSMGGGRGMPNFLQLAQMLDDPMTDIFDDEDWDDEDWDDEDWDEDDDGLF